METDETLDDVIFVLNTMATALDHLLNGNNSDKMVEGSKREAEAAMRCGKEALMRLQHK